MVMDASKFLQHRRRMRSPSSQAVDGVAEIRLTLTVRMELTDVEFDGEPPASALAEAARRLLPGLSANPLQTLSGTKRIGPAVQSVDTVNVSVEGVESI